MRTHIVASTTSSIEDAFTSTRRAYQHRGDARARRARVRAHSSPARERRDDRASSSDRGRARRASYALREGADRLTAMRPRRHVGRGSTGFAHRDTAPTDSRCARLLATSSAVRALRAVVAAGGPARRCGRARRSLAASRVDFSLAAARDSSRRGCPSSRIARRIEASAVPRLPAPSPSLDAFPPTSLVAPHGTSIARRAVTCTTLDARALAAHLRAEVLHRNSSPPDMDKTRPSPPARDENQIIAERRAKLAALRARGNAFPERFPPRRARRRPARALRRARTTRSSRPRRSRVAVAGRMMLKRVMGKACFATLQDMSGRIQLYVTLDARRRRGARRVQALGPGRHRRRDRARCSRRKHRRAVGQGATACACWRRRCGRCRRNSTA